jgi:hypothetical protein
MQTQLYAPTAHPAPEVCRIYEVHVPFRPNSEFLLSVSSSREEQLREDICLGRKLIEIGRMVFETSDFALARQISDAEYV